MEENKSQQEEKLKEMMMAVIKSYSSSGGFVDRKITDTPNDTLSVVNRRFVTLNGATGSRPTSSIIGQRYFDTSLAAGNGKPVWYGPNGWVDASGTPS